MCAQLAPCGKQLLFTDGCYRDGYSECLEPSSVLRVCTPRLEFIERVFSYTNTTASGPKLFHAYCFDRFLAACLLWCRWCLFDCVVVVVAEVVMRHVYAVRVAAMQLMQMPQFVLSFVTGTMRAYAAFPGVATTAVIAFVVYAVVYRVHHYERPGVCGLCGVVGVRSGAGVAAGGQCGASGPCIYLFY